MSWTKRIDTKKYLAGSVINVGFALYVGYPSLFSMFWMAFMVVAVGLNHLFTIIVFSQLVESRLNDNLVSRKKLGFYLILKTVTLFGAFLCLLIFNRDKVPQGLLMYIFQLIILFLSIKNIGQLIKKGSP